MIKWLSGNKQQWSHVTFTW